MRQRDARRRWILLLVFLLHLAILHAVLQRSGRQHLSLDVEKDSRVQLIFLKPARARAKPPEIAEPREPITRLTPPARSLSSRSPVAVHVKPPLTPEAVAPPPETPKNVVAEERKPLDLLAALNSVGPEVAKYDREHPGARELTGARPAASLQAKLDRIFAEGGAAPKWYEGARVDEISSGAQRDAGIRMYKITTFSGSYCVTYAPGQAPLTTLCSKF